MKYKSNDDVYIKIEKRGKIVKRKARILSVIGSAFYTNWYKMNLDGNILMLAESDIIGKVSEFE